MEFSKEELLKAIDLFPSLWVQQHDVCNEGGFPIEFKNHRFMKDLYDDMSPLQVWMKGAQIGATTAQIVKTIYVAAKLNKQIIYTLPTESDIKDMAGGKINRIIAQNEMLKSLVKQHDTVEQKAVGNSIIYYRGTFTNKAAMMVSSDLNVHDEVDASNPDVIQQYETRLQASKDAWRWYFSHPSSPDFGVDKFYKKSDQKKWHITHACGETYVMDETCIDYDQELYICPKCKGEITDEERRMGEWCATSHGDWSGYWIPLWIAPWMQARHIAAYKREKTGEYFANFVAGLPYIGSGNKVSAQTIINCLKSEVNDQDGRVIIGVDTGLPIHIVIANKQGFFYYATLSDPSTGKDPYQELESYLKRWPKSIIVADQGGDLIGIRKLQAAYPGRVFLVWYRRDKAGVELIKWGENDEYGKVTADRNRLIQLFIDEMHDKRVTFNGTEGEWQEYIAHWLNIYRLWEENSLGVNEFKWERTGADHYCFVAGTKIQTEYGEKNIEEISIGDRVLTRNGLRRVYHSGTTQKQVRTVTAYFSNGSIFTSTPDHPLVTTLGKIRVDCTTSHAILYSCLNGKILNTKGLSTDATLTPQDGKTGYILYDKGAEKQLVWKRGFIANYGLKLTELFLKGLSSITEMAIHSITNYQTWCVNHADFIRAITLKIDSKTVLTEQDKINIWNESGVSPMRGAKPPKENNGIGNTLIEVLCYKLPLILNALSAVLKGLRKASKKLNFVPSDVVIVGLHANIEPMDVINLAVEYDAEYFANGILVSNCHASIYARIGLSKYAETMATIVGDNVFGNIPQGRVIKDYSPPSPQEYQGYSPEDFRKGGFGNNSNGL